MILRLLLLVIATAMHLEFYDAFYTQNFYDGMYPAEADSIGIPIFTSMILVVGAAIGSSPFVLIGSKFIMAKLSAAKLWFSIPVATIFLFCYALIIGLSYSGASHIFEDRYRTIAVAAVWLFVVPLMFLGIDAARLFFYVRSNFYLNRISNQ
jgi:hypothetical protein